MRCLRRLPVTRWHPAISWERLGFAGRCPYALPPPPELADHQKKYRLFEAAHNLRYDLAGLLNTATDANPSLSQFGDVPIKSWCSATAPSFHVL
jgi:hypothetical protein